MNKKNYVLYWFYGYAKISIQQMDMIAFLKLCKAKEIFLWKISFTEEGMRCSLYLDDLDRITDYIMQKGGSLEILEKKGFPVFCSMLKPHMCICCFLLFSIGMLLYSQQYVWKISICGNYQNTNDQYLDLLNCEGICVGKLKSDIDCDGLEARIRDFYQNVTWTAVYFTGTTLNIHVKEKETIEYKIDAKDEIISPVEGKIVSVFIHSGNSLVEVGQSVKQGDVLVNAYVPVLNEEMQVVNFQYQIPEAEIKISRLLHYNDKIMKQNSNIVFHDDKKSYHYYLWNNVVFPKRNDRNREKLSEIVACYNRLFVFPKYHVSLSLIEENRRSISYEDNVYTEDIMKKILLDNLTKYILCLQEKGVQFVEKNVKIDKNRDSMEINAELYIIETIF